MIDRNIPVGFQSMGVEVKIEVGDAVKKETLEKLIGVTKKCCIIYQTLKPAIPIQINKIFVFNSDN